MKYLHLTPENINNPTTNSSFSWYKKPTKLVTAEHFHMIMLDTTLTCNLHCLYCHNPRTKQKMSEKDLLHFVNNYVLKVDNFQIGVGMEPTMDKRMMQFIKLIQDSKAKPLSTFRLQTNGTLLHKFNLKEIKSLGINNVSISLDTVDKDLHKQLRGSSDLHTILSNIEQVSQEWEQGPTLVCVVNKLNAKSLPELLDYAIKTKIKTVELRQMIYWSDSNIIQNHKLMENITMSEREFETDIAELKQNYKNAPILIYVNGSNALEEHCKNVWQ